jgi:hypothetical protein
VGAGLSGIGAARRTSGYSQRSRVLLPLRGEAAPWRLRQHYAKDAKLFRGRVDDGALEFS